MKRTLALILAITLFVLIFTACGTGTTPSAGNSGAKIDPAVTGIWYGPEGIPQLDISEDGTGLITYLSKAVEATFSTSDNVFTADCSEYYLNGKYEVSDDRMTVTTEYDNETYSLVFTREIVVIPEDIKGNHIYNIGEKAYEVVIDDDGAICKGIPYPPSEDYPETEIYLTYETINSDPGSSSVSSETETVTPELTINKKPPLGAFTNNKTVESDSTDTTKAKEETSTGSITNTAKPETDEKDKKDLPVPEIIGTDGENVYVVVNDEKIQTTKGGGSIVGTWTSERQTGTAYIFGYTDTFDYTQTFTFNADGTGTVTALIFPGTLTWSLEGNRLDLTISMLGDTESGSAYITLLGDVMYLENHKGELYALSRQ